MKLLLIGCIVLREQFCELVIAQGTSGGDHLDSRHNLHLVSVRVVRLICRTNVLPQLPDG